jgi:hypothetical protein
MRLHLMPATSVDQMAGSPFKRQRKISLGSLGSRALAYPVGPLEARHRRFILGHALLIGCLCQSRQLDMGEELATPGPISTRRCSFGSRSFAIGRANSSRARISPSRAASTAIRPASIPQRVCSTVAAAARSRRPYTTASVLAGLCAIRAAGPWRFEAECMPPLDVALAARAAAISATLVCLTSLSG